MSTVSLHRKSGWVAGADGYPGGWVVVLFQSDTDSVRHRTVASVDALLDLPEVPDVIGLDMVIGLPEEAEPGGRPCDRQARQLLGHPRGASVFSPPARSVLAANSYAHAQRLNRTSGPDAPGLSRQSFNLLPKMRAVAEVMTPERQNFIREVHPELSFLAMNGGVALQAGKHSRMGQDARTDLLEAHGMPEVEDGLDQLPSGSLGPDDVLDAYAACWSAARIRAGTAERCPPRSRSASRSIGGLRMEIWR